ncbi:acetolactate synthase I/II/III large subunit [Exophiala viscosa]|uniref:acetolactate synthase I/II/III large subunit n=1 Tax=Exophiala viscosa TaxID=2486360 RepID=UPI002195A961|nr:acetolactate synthase I/II/III large subunit [Exophiala viscosa]
MPDNVMEWQRPPKRELLGGDLVAQSLKQLGAEVAFGLHGGHLDAFLIGCTLIGIKIIDTRHETTAVQAAEGYAKLSGKAGFCFVTANSGFSNALPGLATAFADRSPIFVITSSPPLRDAETNCLQGFHDQVVLAKPITKFAHRVTNVEEIPRIISHAYRTAIGGIPGPVVIDFPIDILFHPPRMNALSYGSLTGAPAITPYPDPAALDELINLWKSASRPVIVVGTGAARTTTRGSKSSVLLDLAEATNTPVFYSQKYLPALPFDSPFRGGYAASLASLPSIQKKQPDLVLLLGARTGFLLGGRSGVIIPNSGCKVAQVDIDASEIGKSNAIELGIVSDATKFVVALLEKLRNNNPIQRQDSWLQDLQDLKNHKSPHSDDSETLPDGRLHPFFTMKTIFETLPEGSIIIIDGGEAGIWAAELLEQARPAGGMVATGYLGFLGNGWGYSIGAALAVPDRLIVNIHGDGSAGFHIQELDTFARHRLNVLTIIMNNYFWGMSVAGQDLIYEDEDPARVASTLSEDCRYDIVAQGFGCKGAITRKSLDEVRDAVKSLTETKGPGLLNAIISRNPITMGTRGMVGKTDDKNYIVVPYYDNVPRPYYKEDAPTTNGTADKH